LPVGHNFNWIRDARLLEGAFHHENVIFVVLDQKDRFA